MATSPAATETNNRGRARATRTKAKRRHDRRSGIACMPAILAGIGAPAVGRQMRKTPSRPLPERRASRCLPRSPYCADARAAANPRRRPPRSAACSLRGHAALFGRAAGFDPDAVALDARRARRAHLAADREPLAGAAARGADRRGRTFLPACRRRLARPAGRDRGCRRRRHPRRIGHSPAGRQESVSVAGAQVRPQDVEVPLAYWLVFVLGRRRTLEIYLNIAEWGPS